VSKREKRDGFRGRVGREEQNNNKNLNVFHLLAIDIWGGSFTNVKIKEDKRACLKIKKFTTNALR